MTIVEELHAAISEGLDGMSPAEVELADAVGRDAASLVAQALTGADVDAEFRHVRAQATLLTFAVRERAQSAVIEAIGRIARKIVEGAL